MGDLETVCQLCGVSFAIARLRRADEPEEAAWCDRDFDFVYSNGWLCRKGSGCTAPYRSSHCIEEHIADPGCALESGYSGHRISLAEMKGCLAVQCLVKKDADWVPEDHDQDFEVEGGY